MICREQYEPGNATRYDLVYVEWGDDYDKTFSLTWFIGSVGLSFRLKKNLGVSAEYVQDKTGWKGSDLAAILGYLKRKGVVVINMPHGYNEYGCFEVEDAHDNLYLANKFNQFLNEPISE